MNTNLLNIIKQIVAQHGESILANPQKLKPLFADYAKAEAKMDRVAFGRAIENGFYMELKHASPANRAHVKATLVSRLQTITGFDKSCCTSAVDMLEAVILPSTQPNPPKKAIPMSTRAPWQPPHMSPDAAKTTQGVSNVIFGLLVMAVVVVVLFFLLPGRRSGYADRVLNGTWVCEDGLNGFIFNNGYFRTIRGEESFFVGTYTARNGMITWTIPLMGGGTANEAVRTGTYSISADLLRLSIDGGLRRGEAHYQAGNMLHRFIDESGGIFFRR